MSVYKGDKEDEYKEGPRKEGRWGHTQGEVKGPDLDSTPRVPPEGRWGTILSERNDRKVREKFGKQGKE